MASIQQGVPGGRFQSGGSFLMAAATAHDGLLVFIGALRVMRLKISSDGPLLHGSEGNTQKLP